MGKLLFWAVVILGVLFAARLLARSGGRQGAKPAPPPGNTPDMSSAEAMVRCEHCGIHLPRSEAYLSNGRTWCGPEHARLGSTRS